MTLMNLNHKNIIFVPGCLLCPSYQANFNEKNQCWNQEILAFLYTNQIELVQMPCPESSFDNKDCGIARKPHGLQFYETLPGFNEHCLSLCTNVVAEIYNFGMHGYRILAIIGIEHSPTCSVSYMYTHLGTIHRSGIFIGNIMDALDNANINVPFIGINRRFPQKAIAKIDELLKDQI